MCRYHLEQKQNVTIVCPDPALQNHISHELLRFHIHQNTSLGEPLARTVVGGFMCDLARLKQQFSPNILFAVLKNPLCFKVCEEGRLAYLEKVRRLELTASRSKAFTLGTLWSEVAEILEKFFKNTNTLENLFQAAYELSCGHKTPSVTFAECPLFQKEDGKALWLFYEELRNQSILGDSQDKLGTFIALMPPVQFYEGLGSSVRILGTLEARLVGDSVVILTSLNEESWPKATPPSCWVPTALRTHLGLPPLESFIGLAAHDFASCFHGNLYITRSRESRGKTQEPSRFWQRLQAVAEKNDVRPSKNPWLLLAQQHHVPLESLPLKAPAPCPPQNTRPTHITISDVNLLVKDPYGFYAKTCLRLTPLPPLEGKKNDTMKRGNLVHSLLEYALKNSTDSIKHEMIRLFQKHGLKNAFWGQQFLRIVQWAYNDLKKRGNVEHFLEQQGEMTLSVDNKSIVVKGRADRIDSIEKGKHVCIIDYKTGTLPTIKDVHQGYAPQLPLEALMLHKGAFHESLTYVNSLELWHVRGFEPVVDVKKLTVDSDFLKHSHNGFLLLLKTFLCEETPFLACPNPKKAPTLKDYNHLERLEEWQQWAQF
jgi:ATP-dependent helicase/nuclease subunit B